MHEEVKMAGFGGQGVGVISEILARAALLDGKNLTWLPSYGPEARTGTANFMVVISEEKIGSPFVEYPDSLIVMNEPSLEKFSSTVKSGGLIVLNKSLVDWDSSRGDVEILEIRAPEIAQELGDPRVANMVILAAYLKKKRAVSFESIQKALEVVAAEKGWNKDLTETNKKALKQGFF